MPPDYDGEFGPTIKPLAIKLYFNTNMTERNILDFLKDAEVKISARQLSNFLIKDQEVFHQEKDALYEAGLKSSPWQNIDVNKSYFFCIRSLVSKVSKKVKVMTAKEAVKKFVFDGSVIGIGGQNILRCAMSLTHEIIRQGKKDLTLTGCNLSIHMDLMVGAGLVKKCESGLGGLGRFGSTFQFKRAIEEKRMETEDYDHLTMASRFLAGEMGIPFIPVRGLAGSDILKYSAASTRKKFEIINNPWNQREKIVLVPAMEPDVSIIHVQKADEIGNVLIQGIASHEPELIRASKSTIVSCEEIVPTKFFRSNPDSTTIPYHYIDAVVEQPFGAFPTATIGYYSFDADHINCYQQCARSGGEKYEKYMKKYIYGSQSFDDFLDKCGGVKKLDILKREMAKLI